MSRILPTMLAAASCTLALLAATPAQAHRCGTAFAMQNQKETLEQQKAGKKAYKAVKIKSACAAEAYYDSVYTRETDHFQIFYVLDGLHATTPEYIDSLAVSLEDAFTFHTKTMRMRAPTGLDTSSQYRKPVKSGLFPVEVAELDFLRDANNIFGDYMCNGCFGVTYSEIRNMAKPQGERDFRKAEILFDNDFVFVPEISMRLDTLTRDGKNCPYPIATETLTNQFYGYSYQDEWAKGIRVTAFHEMFHAVQLQYKDLFESWTYWTEASATANEEIGVPELNDYIRYIPAFINSTGTPLHKISSEYSISLLYLYIYNHVDKHFDKEIWELFEKNPHASLSDLLKTVLDKHNVALDSLYQSFVTALALSGENASMIDSSVWVHNDQPKWPTVRPDSIKQNGTFTPDTTNYAFNYYKGGTPAIEDYKGNASAIVFRDKAAILWNISNTASFDTIATKAFFADSIFWVFSRFGETKYIPQTIKDSTLRAYPVPWRGQDQLCFTPLPESKKFIEIRNARGDLVLREPYEKTTHCIDADKVKSKMKPGVYRFRAGSSGKAQKFIVTY